MDIPNKEEHITILQLTFISRVVCNSDYQLNTKILTLRCTTYKQEFHTPQPYPCRTWGEQKWLAETQNDRIILDIEKKKTLEVFPDANFCGNWTNLTSPEDVSIEK